MGEEYKRTCHDELEWAEIEQLHAATLEISKNCFEYKKLCIGLLGVGGALVLKFSDTPLSHTTFLISLLVCIGFWLADATAFYYQRSVRRVMDTKFKEIASRNELPNYDRKITEVSKSMALFNPSMTLYYSLVLVVVGGWVIYAIS